MEKNKNMMVISILLLIIMLIGTTFSYFSAIAIANNDINVTAAQFGVSLEVTPLYNGKKLIPMNDSDVMTGYNSQCIDRLGYGACYAYNIHIENTGDLIEYTGLIKFTVSDILHLKYLLLDEDNNRYVDALAIESSEDQTLGDSFKLDTGESRNFVLVIWLSNLPSPQDADDAGGNFSALVTYRSTNGGMITGTFSN